MRHLARLNKGCHAAPPMAKGQNVYMETFGCQMNVLDSELVETQLASIGYGFTQNPADADVVLLNTCSVRDLSEQKVWSMLGRLGLDPQAEDRVIGVMGCMAEREGEKIHRRMPHVDILCGPSELDRIPSLIENAQRNRGKGHVQAALSGHTNRRSTTLDHAREGLEALDLSRSFEPTRGAGSQAYVRITRGCNKFCSFCVVPFTRGAEVHRPPEHIIDEVKRLVDHGVLEVTLLGQTVNHYTHADASFAQLLWKIHEAVPELPRLRFITSYPRDFTDEALDVMAASPRICPYLHIPAQSGSNAMLKRMNRGYTVESYLELLDRARARMPHIRLAGDMIVGYPGETQDDHEASIELLRKARYKSCFIFKYSPRSGTVAFNRHEDDVPESVKKARNHELLDVQGQISQEVLGEHVGREVSVLVEAEAPHRGQGPQPTSGHTRLKGRTVGDEIVIFDGPKHLIGSIVDVRATRATQLTLIGELGNKGQASRPAAPQVRLPVL